MDSFGRLAGLQLVKDGDVRTYLANDPETGLQVLLHLRRTELLDREFNKKFRKWLEAEPRELLDKGEYDGLIYVVTELSGPWRSLTEIVFSFDELSFNQPKASVAVAARPVGTARGNAELNGDETQPFFESAPMGQQVIEKKPEHSIPVQSAPFEARTEDHAKEAAQPGEFTRMFGLPASGDPVSSEHVASKEKVGEEPDDFARMFAGNVAEEKQAEAAPGLNAGAHSQTEPGEFTRLFGIPVGDVQDPDVKREPTSAHAKVAPPRAIESPTLPISQSEPGEFARVFPSGQPSRRSATTKPAERVSAPPLAEVKTDVDPNKTRLFAPPESPVRPEEKKPEPGSFTQLFRSPTGPPIEPSGGSSLLSFDNSPYAGRGEHEVDFRNLPAEGSRTSQTANAPAGEFTQMFGKPGSSARQNESLPQSGDAGATGLFSAGVRSATPQSMGAPGTASGPGEYTRMFGGGQPKSAEATPAAHAAPVSPVQRQSSNQTLILIVAFGVLLLLAVALVLILVLRR